MDVMKVLMQGNADLTEAWTVTEERRLLNAWKVSRHVVIGSMCRFIMHLADDRRTDASSSLFEAMLQLDIPPCDWIDIGVCKQRVQSSGTLSKTGADKNMLHDCTGLFMCVRVQ